jgi:hypothetical protein
VRHVYRFSPAVTEEKSAAAFRHRTSARTVIWPKVRAAAARRLVRKSNSGRAADRLCHRRGRFGKDGIDPGFHCSIGSK